MVGLNDSIFAWDNPPSRLRFFHLDAGARKGLGKGWHRVWTDAEGVGRRVRLVLCCPFAWVILCNVRHARMNGWMNGWIPFVAVQCIATTRLMHQSHQSGLVYGVGDNVFSKDLLRGSGTVQPGTIFFFGSSGRHGLIHSLTHLSLTSVLSCVRYPSPAHCLIAGLKFEG
ncbi:hypothetical protein BGZ63DRAFT_209260 [Mariannaea sp. PMI_226]|nr:hypothetical protein BGZ63DRAFT_209260 [Mariannaea sp. PMI_226]